MVVSFVELVIFSFQVTANPQDKKPEKGVLDEHAFLRMHFYGHLFTNRAVTILGLHFPRTDDKG